MQKNDLQKAVELINSSKNVLITTHTKPDGDSCGCLVAFAHALNTLQKKARILSLSKIPKWYEFLFQQNPTVLGEDITLGQLKQDQFDLVIIVDTNSYSQLPGLEDFLKENKKPVLVIDHHVTSDGLGDIELIDTNAAAAALIVYDLFEYAGWKITKKIAQAIITGLATDTGWFRFPNTDRKCFQVTAQLIDLGVNPTQIYHNMYQNFSPARFQLMTEMLNSLELHFDGRYAAQHLLKSDFKKTAAEYADTENLIDECQRINTVEAAALFVELPDDRIKVSFRSRTSVDVRKIAQKFGGGGHIKAAGAHLTGPIENAEKLIYDEVAKQLAGINRK